MSWPRSVPMSEAFAPQLREMAATVPLGRFGNEAEVSAGIVFLLSPAASFISGTTLRIDGGRSDKLRPGDIVGALTGDAGLSKDSIGKIDVYATRSYVAIARTHAKHALERLRAGKIKGRKFRVNLL